MTFDAIHEIYIHVWAYQACISNLISTFQIPALLIAYVLIYMYMLHVLHVYVICIAVIRVHVVNIGSLGLKRGLE